MGEPVEVVRKRLRVRAEPEAGLIWLDLETFSQPLRVAVSVDTLDGGFDRAVRLDWDGAGPAGDVDRLSWTGTSTLWHKRYRVDVHADHVEFHAELRGTGEVDAIRYFDAIDDAGFRPHFALTKHFNDKGFTHPRTYSRGSPVAFRRVYCPEPNYYGRQEVPAYEDALVSVNADFSRNGGNAVFSPGLLAYAVAAEPDREWLAMGLAVEPGEYLFSDLQYLGGETFALNVPCWGARRVDGAVRTPRVVLVPGRTAEDALRRYVAVLRDAGLVPSPRRDQPDWWSRPMLCGWGHQCYQGDLFRVRSGPERPADNAVYTLCTQANYQDLAARVDALDLPVGTVVVDARWSLSGGLKDVDAGRWPDLRGFVDAQHRRGRRVLLWWGPWDTEGLPVGECVFSVPDGRRPNPPGRYGRYGAPGLGRKLGVDLTLPHARERVRRQVRFALGPDGLDADGIKIDHMVTAPGMYGMTFHPGSGRLFGIEAVRDCLALLYETAKETKADALISGQSPNPYLADVQDVIRLGDIYTHNPDTVVPEMRMRAAMARIADPTWLIDADGWPMPSLAALREYVRVQPELGVPSLYYLTHVDTTGEALTADDYALIRRVWAARPG
jgi:hypothetical protein